MNADEYTAALATCGGVQSEIPQKERWRLMQSWREFYAAPFHRKTGKWKNGQFEWHVFSSGDSRALNGSRAIAAYVAEQPQTVVVMPEEDEYPAILIDLPQGKNRRPDFSAIYADVCVWPLDLAWTMAFTHEQEMGLGPYFSRREWLG